MDGGEELVCHIAFPGAGGGVRERRPLTEPARGGAEVEEEAAATTTTTTTTRRGEEEDEEQPPPVAEAPQQQQQQAASAAGKEPRPRGTEEFVFVYEEEKRPVVVLLGWAGCQDKYLAKYSAIYEERSCITLRCTAPVDYLFWRRDQLPHVSRRLVRMIEDKCSSEHPVFFHVFSNGGAIFYQHISFAMQEAGTPLKVKGVIFDSSPGERRITSLFRAASAIIGGHPLTNLPISFMLTFLLSFIWLFEIIAHSVGKPNAVKTDPIALAEETYSWPQIFLYSNADTLIPASDVEKFASRRAERGVRAQLVLFTDSPHVKHYATYRDVYVSTVCGFVNQCLAEPEAPAGPGLPTAPTGHAHALGPRPPATTTTTTTTTTTSSFTGGGGGGGGGCGGSVAPTYLTKRIVLPEEAGGCVKQ